MSDIEALQEIMKGENFRILTVNYGEKESKVRKFMDQFSYTFDVIVDEHNKIGSEFKISGLPTTFILDQDGKIMGKALGPRRWKDKSFILFFKKISKI